MRFLKFLLFLLIIAILAVGGLFYAAQMGYDVSGITSMLGRWGGGQEQDHTGMAGHQMPGAAGPAPSPFNSAASQNRTKLNQALTSLNQAMDMITIDPYSQITMPNRMSEYPRETAPNTAPGSTNRENITININPPATTTPTAPGATPGVATTPPVKDLPPTVNIVFDQYKLEQVHDGIFKLSQATTLLDELNNDLADQSVMGELNPPNQQTLIVRYNLTLQNRNKIAQATRLLRDATVLVNVNPYAPQSGYVFSSQRMQQLHQGITELAKSTIMLNRLTEDFNQQMMLTANDIRAAAYTGMGNMDQGQHGGGGNLNSGMGSLVLNLGFLVVVLGIVLGILILIQRLLRDLLAPAGEKNKISGKGDRL